MTLNYRDTLDHGYEYYPMSETYTNGGKYQ
jgi:hypothetical protein